MHQNRVNRVVCPTKASLFNYEFYILVYAFDNGLFSFDDSLVKQDAQCKRKIINLTVFKMKTTLSVTD